MLIYPSLIPYHSFLCYSWLIQFLTLTMLIHASITFSCDVLLHGPSFPSSFTLWMWNLETLKKKSISHQEAFPWLRWAKYFMSTPVTSYTTWYWRSLLMCPFPSCWFHILFIFDPHPQYQAQCLIHCSSSMRPCGMHMNCSGTRITCSEVPEIETEVQMGWSIIHTAEATSLGWGIHVSPDNHSLQSNRGD